MNEKERDFIKINPIDGLYSILIRKSGSLLGIEKEEDQ